MRRTVHLIPFTESPSSPPPARPFGPHPCPGWALPHLQAPLAPRRDPREESFSRLRAPWSWGRWRAGWSGRQWVWGLGEAAVAAWDAAASYPATQTAEMEIGGGSGGREPRRRGRGSRRHRGGRSQSEKAGRGEMGEELLGRGVCAEELLGREAGAGERGAGRGRGCLGAGTQGLGGFTEAQ